MPRDIGQRERAQTVYWLGLGLALYWIIPSIEKQTLLFRALWGMIFLGGMGRLASMLFLAIPPLPFVGFTILEIVGAHFFVWWQSRLNATCKALVKRL